jgi:hypothetical protein
MSNLNTVQAPESGLQILENLYVNTPGTETNSSQLEGLALSWDQFMNELEFE